VLVPAIPFLRRRLAIACAAGPLLASPATAATRRPHQHLCTSPLTLSAPAVAAPLLSGVQATLRPSCTYTGHGALAWALVHGPAGMTADAATGALTWTPSAALEGQQATVIESVTDGTYTATTTFTVVVATSTAVTTSVVGSTVTVTQAGTMQGFAVTLPGTASLPPAQVKVSTLTPGQAPPIPDGVTRISDFFRVTPVDGGAGLITLTLPTANVPSGRTAQDVRLFVYADAAMDAEDGGEVEGTFWIRTWYGFDVLASGKASIKLQGLGELAFVGVDPPAPAAAPVIPAGSVTVGAEAVSIACSPFATGMGLPDLAIQVCTLSGDVALTVLVKDFSRLNTNPATTRDQFLGWLASARRAFANLGLGSDGAFEVVFEPMPADVPNALGFVTSGNLENYRVLHITNARKNRDSLQGTSVHEFYHHAQSRSSVAGLTNLLTTDHRGDWMVEGTARWFEDYLFDTLNTYRLKEGQPLSEILTWGLAEAVNDQVPETRGYARFAFWKMIESSCSGFSLPAVLNCNTGGDPACLANLKSRIESPGWQCDFGGGFADENRATLASALLAYTYGTAYANDMNVLDGNEPHFDFQAPQAWQTVTSSGACTTFASCPAGSMIQGFLRPAAAVAFVIPAVDPLDPGAGAMVEVKSDDGGELWAWLADNERRETLADETWAKTTDSWSNLYAPSGRAPETMVVLVNPDPSQAVKFSIRAGRAQTLYIFPDLDAKVWAPIFAWGCPTADYTLVARTPDTAPLPEHYRAVWNFGDGTPEVTVTDDPTVEHAWANVGTVTATLKIYEMPANTLVNQATTPIYIKWFAGRYRLLQFTGNSSGVIGDPYAQWVLQFVPKMLAHPEWSLFGISEWRTSKDADFTTLPPGEDGDTWYIGYWSADAPGAADCPNGIAINGASYSGRFSAATTDTKSILCMSSTATQSGTEVQGTFSYWTRYYQCGSTPESCTVKNEGQGSYTFSGSYTPH
jgi:hypothetical protein